MVPVQGVTQKGVGTGVAMTFGASTTNGNKRIARVFHSTSTAPTAVDSGWTRLDDNTGPWFVWENTTNGVNSFNCTFASSGSILAKLDEWSGVGASDKFKQGNGTDAAPTSGATTNVVAAGELGLGMHASPSGGDISFVGAGGWTGDAFGTGITGAGKLNDGTNGNCALFTSKTLGAGGAGYAAQAGCSANLVFSAIVTFQDAGGGGGGANVDDDQII